MKSARIAFGVVCLLPLLAACVPYPTSSGPADLHLQDIQARHTQEVIDAAYTATAVEKMGVIATQVVVAHQTEMAMSMYLTQQAADIVATQAAATMLADMSNATATSQSVSATGTADALAAFRAATATEEMARATATQQTILLAREQLELERQHMTNILKAFAGWVLLFVVFGLGVWLLIRATPWVLLHRFGKHEWHGKPYTIIPDGKGGAMVGDVARAVGAGLILDGQAREVRVSGIPENPDLLLHVLTGAQAAELLLAANSGNSQWTPAQRTTMLQKMLPEMAQRVAQSPYRILPPQAMPVLLDHKTGEIIEAEWREADDE